MVRSNHWEVFCKKGVLRNFAKFTGKHLCQSVFLNKVAGLRREVSQLAKVGFHFILPGFHLGLGGNQTIVPKENYAPVRIRVWLRVSFGVGRQFSLGAVVLEP